MGFTPTHDDPLLLLAMDHRTSLGKSLYGVVDDKPTPGQIEAMEQGKHVVYEGLEQASGSVSDGHPGVLVDERYGRAVIDAVDRSTARQTVLAVPIEHSDQEWFSLEWGGLGDATWTEHLQAIRPDFAKILVRDNPEYDVHERHAQLTHLRTVSDLLAEIGIPLLYELLVPATDGQKAKVGGDTDAYDRDVRPDLVARVIESNHEAGVFPAIWKIEGLETADAARLVVAAARADGGTADCVVLGRDAPTERLDHWLTVAAPVDGFVGFAIGRSIWEEALQSLNNGTIERTEAVSRIADRYLHFVGAYLKAR